MSVTDFLTNGQPVQAVPTSGSTETVLPDWYTNYAMQILSNQDAISNTPYTTYGGPRVAGFTPDQQKGFDATKTAASSYQPLLNQAGDTLQSTAGRSGLSAAQPNITTAQGYYANSATPTGINMANPYLAAAGQTSVNNINQYMNPYNDAVTNRIGVLAGRNLQENLLPEINDRFTGAGTFGGSRQAEAIGRALRDTQESALAQQTSALQQGYGQATGLQQADLLRQAQLAQTAGNLGQEQQQILQNAGQGTGALGQMTGNLYNTDTTNARALAEQQAALAGQTQSLGLTGAGALQQIGAQQQNLNQKNLDVAYQDFKDQRDYGQQQVANQIGALQGVKSAVPTGSLTNEDKFPTDVGPSKLSTLGATAANVAAVIKAMNGG